MQNINQKGYAILFTIVIVTIISVITVGLSSTTQKQNVISSVAKDSRTAFYMADTAIECALYADNVMVPNTTTPPDPPFTKGFYGIDSTNNNPIVSPNFLAAYPSSDYFPCGKKINEDFFSLIFTNPLSSGSNEVTYTLSPEDMLGHSTEPCFEINIIKTYDSNDHAIVTNTEIEAKGYSSCIVNSNNTVQRQINVNYY